MDNYRLLVAFLICVAVIVLYQQMLQSRYPQAPHHQHPTHQQVTPVGAPTPLTMPSTQPRLSAQASPMAAPSPAHQPATGAPPPTVAAQPPNEIIFPMRAATHVPVRTVKIDTDLYKAVLTSDGARLRSFSLDKYKETDVPGSGPYQMVRGHRMPFGLVISHEDNQFSDTGLTYSTNAPAQIEVTPGKPAVVTFTATTAAGVKLKKTYTFRDSSYVFALKAKVDAESRAVAPVAVGLTLSQPLKQIEEGYHDIPLLQGFIHKAFTEGESTLKKGVKPLSGPITYAGFGDRYFLTAFLPQTPNNGTLWMNYNQGEAHARIVFAGTSTLATQVYMGPKELHLLENVNPHLSKAIDFGWTGIIALPFLRALDLLHRIAPNYGVAIILLTVIVRLATLPMSIKSQRSMMRMQRLQPQVERIREKFKDDQERLNREMVDLYKRNHVNPLGGCLPMVIQLPVLWGLYEALLNAVELRQAPFWLWIRDLSAPDCLSIHGLPAIPFTTCHGLPVLVLLMAATSLIQQYMMPRQADPSQQKMMLYMPVIFSLIFIDLPAGLSLYYLASNVLGIIQQFFLNREFQQYAPAT
ncbi:MAG: membrane protein insertase YidC [Candidatus Binataceae bacterium]